jgi:hypothetical protein
MNIFGIYDVLLGCNAVQASSGCSSETSDFTYTPIRRYNLHNQATLSPPSEHQISHLKSKLTVISFHIEVNICDLMQDEQRHRINGELTNCSEEELAEIICQI